MASERPPSREEVIAVVQAWRRENKPDMGPGGDAPDCGYCVERLAVNVGLMEQNRQLRAALATDPSRWSFDTLMTAADALLEERYPADVFVGGPDADPGPRLVAALRDCRAALRNEQEDR